MSQTPPAKPLQHVLCPVDASASSEFALIYAARFARACGARVTVLHVLEMPTDIFPDDVLPMGAEVRAKLREARERDIAELVGRCFPDTEVATEIAEGPPHQVICERAQELGADLIIMGTHGRRALGRLLLGSVAERVLRASHVPVMTIRKPGERDAG